MIGAIGQRWQPDTCKAIIEIIGTSDSETYQTKVIYSSPDNKDYHFQLGHEEGYFRDRFTDNCARIGVRFTYLDGQDKPKV